MSKAILSLGSNIGNRFQNIQNALIAISKVFHTDILSVSHYYQTKAVEVLQEQKDYINICVYIQTALSPHALLGACLGIEAAFGRKRKDWHASRILDIDVLLYKKDTKIIGLKKELILPHPRLLKRAFVLFPLWDLFPEKIALGLDFSNDLEKVKEQEITRYNTRYNNEES